MTTPPPADPNLPPQQPPPGYQQGPPPAAQPAPPLTAQQDIDYAVWTYWSTLLGFIPPLILWLVFKNRGPRMANEGKEALNFGITVSAAYFVISLLFGILSLALGPQIQYQTIAGISYPVGATLGIGWVFTLIGWLLTLGVLIVAILWNVKAQGVVRAGGSWRYPFALRFVK